MASYSGRKSRKTITILPDRRKPVPTGNRISINRRQNTVRAFTFECNWETDRSTNGDQSLQKVIEDDKIPSNRKRKVCGPSSDDVLATGMKLCSDARVGLTSSEDTRSKSVKTLLLDDGDSDVHDSRSRREAGNDRMGIDRNNDIDSMIRTVSKGARNISRSTSGHSVKVSSKRHTVGSNARITGNQTKATPKLSGVNVENASSFMSRSESSIVQNTTGTHTSVAELSGLQRIVTSPGDPHVHSHSTSAVVGSVQQPEARRNNTVQSKSGQRNTSSTQLSRLRNIVISPVDSHSVRRSEARQNNTVQSKSGQRNTSTKQLSHLQSIVTSPGDSQMDSHLTSDFTESVQQSEIGQNSTVQSKSGQRNISSTQLSCLRNIVISPEDSRSVQQSGSRQNNTVKSKSGQRNMSSKQLSHLRNTVISPRDSHLASAVTESAQHSETRQNNNTVKSKKGQRNTSSTQLSRLQSIVVSPVDSHVDIRSTSAVRESVQRSATRQNKTVNSKRIKSSTKLSRLRSTVISQGGFHLDNQLATVLTPSESGHLAVNENSGYAVQSVSLVTRQTSASSIRKKSALQEIQPERGNAKSKSTGNTGVVKKVQTKRAPRRKPSAEELQISERKKWRKRLLQEQQQQLQDKANEIKLQTKPKLSAEEIKKYLAELRKVLHPTR